ncbi:AAA family ATPase [Sphingomonas sp. 1185]|uniref:AAA family ATPase n=1 Tax=Sphingomonas sp. 1185 TaxID=3156411 RepID=UPI00339A2962
MANDSVLRERLAELAANDPRLTIDKTTTRNLADDFGIELSRSPNALYRIRVSEPGEAPFEAVAFTLILNASNRPATRAEALGQAIAQSDGRLFERNPLLLVFDYHQNRFLIVAASTLFGAFAKEAARRDIPASGTSSFSLTPNFEHRTITMYATVSSGQLWAGDMATLNGDALIEGLKRVRSETQSADADEIVAAVKNRLAATPAVDLGSDLGSAVVTVPLDGDDDDEIRVDSRLWRMIITAIRSSPAVILVGPPGTGKTALLGKAIRALAEDPQFVPEGGVFHDPLWATPDESWTARDLVGGDTIVDGQIRFRAGWVVRAIADDRWLVLDEANRADMDRIFGGLLTWLSGGTVSIGTEHSGSDAREVLLGWSPGASSVSDGPEDAQLRYRAGSNWRMLGTYNALDAQRVFRFGQALGRRFVRVPIPALSPDLFDEVLSERARLLPADLRHAITRLYAAHFASSATILGPALFIALAGYLGSALAGNTVASSEASDATAGAPLSDGILAEAYVVHIGTWLAQLEPQDREALRDRVQQAGVFSDVDWGWIEAMIVSLA